MASNQPIPEEYTDGYVVFMGNRFMVDERVLIPRLETEELVKYCLKFLEKNPQIQTIVDIGTGSGIIPISLLSKMGRPLTVFATDMSQEALEVVGENYQKISGKTPFLKGEKNIDLAEGDLWDNKSSVTPSAWQLLQKGAYKAWNFAEIPYRSDLTERAQELRKNMTGPEKKIWYTALKQDTFKWLRFLRQKPSPSLGSGTSFKKEVFEQIQFLQWDLLQPLIRELWNSIPEEILITANLPYVREVEINSWLMHEPRMAFLGGVQTGFELYERFFDQIIAWKQRPRKCHVVIEFGLWQRDIAETVFMSKDCSYTFFADLRGIERFAHICLSR
jgi:methylase of polypeptide subunit release factors